MYSIPGIHISPTRTMVMHCLHEEREPKRGLRARSCSPPQPGDILLNLYTDGWSATIDASKFFHMFKTVAAERTFMGIIHPLTELEYWYDRFLIGSSNSPGNSGHLGAAFLQLIIDNCHEFQGCAILNHPLLNGSYNPCMDKRCVLVGLDVLPAILICINVDDVFVHCPSKYKLMAGLTFIVDTAVRLGLICQPIKTSPPCADPEVLWFLII
jgi:hypothetical protein